MSQHSTAIPAVPAGYEAARRRAAFFARADRGVIVATGRDRASYLQGMLTNDIAALKPGEGCYAAYLTPQGRMIADAYVYELGDLMILSVPRARTDTMLERLRQYVFSEDVQLSDATTDFDDIVIIGPASADIVAGLLTQDHVTISGMPEHACRRGTFDDRHAILLRVADLGVAGYELIVTAGESPVLTMALEQSGATRLTPEARETLRVEAGVPLFGTDMDEETIPLEAGIEQRAISLTKGCYVGQEVIIRVLHRGHGRVAKKLVGLALDDAEAAHVPPRGARIAIGDREIGTVTSSTASPARGRPIALGYVARDFAAPDTAVAIDGAPAHTVSLPFVT